MTYPSHTMPHTMREEFDATQSTQSVASDFLAGVSSNKTISRLDWPTSEMIAAAHRARAKALREMTSALARKLWFFLAAGARLANRARRHGRQGHHPVQRQLPLP
jgi:hypothetical protein